jgi:hypothetical protein
MHGIWKAFTESALKVLLVKSSHANQSLYIPHPPLIPKHTLCHLTPLVGGLGYH